MERWTTLTRKTNVFKISFSIRCTSKRLSTVYTIYIRNMAKGTLNMKHLNEYYDTELYNINPNHGGIDYFNQHAGTYMQ